MANFFVDLFCGLMSCFRGSLRIILFFGCLLYVLLQVANVINVFYDCDTIGNVGRKTFFEEPSNSLLTYISALVTLGVGLLGTSGTFYNHHKSIKMFTILLALISVLMGVSLAYYLRSGAFAEQHDRFIGRMKNNTRLYDWSGKGSMSHKSEETALWDLVQSLKCCGLMSYKDWDEVRPINLPNNVYPSSCCGLPREGYLCPKSTIYPDGCIVRIQAGESFFFITTTVHIGFQIFLCLIAYILLLPDCSDDFEQSSSRRHRVVPSPYQGYRRFENRTPVQMRQPPVAPQFGQRQYQQSTVEFPPSYQDLYFTKMNAPPSYQ